MGGDNDAALREYVASRYPQLRRSAYLMCGDWALADELTHETLARLITDIRHAGVEDPDGYAYAELMAAFPGKRRRREHVFVAPPDGDQGHDPTETILLLDALQKLAPRCRAVLVLRYWARLDTAEVADVLGLDDERVDAYEAAGSRALRSLLGEAQPAGAV
jgi:RNA polymerase sigma factor (sigma-70 family)